MKFNIKMPWSSK